MSFLRKTKRNYYAQLDNKTVTDDRKVWKAVSPLFSEKTFCKESIILKEHGKTITDNEKLAQKFYNFFSNIVKNLNIDSDVVMLQAKQTTQTLSSELSRNMLIIQAD